MQIKIKLTKEQIFVKASRDFEQILVSHRIPTKGYYYTLTLESVRQVSHYILAFTRKLSLY